jgi:hypothetical protein
MLRSFTNRVTEWGATLLFSIVFLVCAGIDKAFDFWNGNLWSDEERD